MDLDRDIAEYAVLKEQYETLGKRLEMLKGRIKRALVQQKKRSYDTPLYRASVLVRTRNTVDQLDVEQMFAEKGIYDEYSEPYIPENAVEQAYLDEKLDDSDLRTLMKSDYNLALTVERLDDDV